MSYATSNKMHQHATLSLIRDIPSHRMLELKGYAKSIIPDGLDSEHNELLRDLISEIIVERDYSYDDILNEQLQPLILNSIAFFLHLASKCLHNGDRLPVEYLPELFTLECVTDDEGWKTLIELNVGDINYIAKSIGNPPNARSAMLMCIIHTAVDFELQR